jgi:outer membrane protein assembly factor BamB
MIGKISNPFMMLLCLCLGCFPEVTPWRWYATHADSNNSDYAAVDGPRDIQLAWQRTFDGTINLGPTTDSHGRLYITTSAEGCHLYALDQATGEILWCSSEIGRLAVASSALVDHQGQIYVADDSFMFSFNPRGDVLWKTPIVGFPLSSQFTSSGRLIFMTHIGVLYVLDKITGEAILEQELTEGNRARLDEFDPVACMRGTRECPCANTLAIDQRTNRLYFTYWVPDAVQAELWAMQYVDGPTPRVDHVWRNSSLPGGSGSSPDISFDGTRIYVNDNEGGLHAIDALTGSNIWRFDIGYATGGSQSTSPRGTIVPAGGTNAPLLCLQDAGTTARLRWKIDSVVNRGVATQARGGLIYATLADESRGRPYNYMAILEVASGRIIDREELPGATWFTVGTTVGGDGNVYTAAFNGKLFAFMPTHMKHTGGIDSCRF